MRMPRTLLAALLSLWPCLAWAQTGYVAPDGISRYPGVTILCPNGTRAAPCSFGGGNSGAVSINLGTAPVSASNRFPVTESTLDGLVAAGAMKVSGTFWQATQPTADTALDALISGGAFKIGGTVALTGAELTAPGTQGTQAVTVQGVAGGIAVAVTCSSGCAGVNGSVAAAGGPAPAAAAQIAMPNPAGNLTAPVLNADGGLPAHVTNFPATQATADAALDGLISGGALSVALASGAAKASYQTNTQAPVAPAAATATASTLVGCQSNTTLPSFAAGQQGAIPCDGSGRPYVVTVPSANNVPGYLQAVGSGGAYTARYINAAGSAMASLVKSSTGMIYGYEVCNGGSAAVYFRLFNLGVVPTVGTSTPAISKVVPAGACSGYSTDVGLVFGTGIALDVTSGSLADSDTSTVASANQVAVEVYSH